MSVSVVDPPSASRRLSASGPEHCLWHCEDGIYADPAVLGTTVLAAVDAVLRAGSFFAGLDYAVLIKALFGVGPALPSGPDGQPLVRLARDILPFDPARRALYRAVKIIDGRAEYCFEPVYETGPDGEELPSRLDIDEFVADMWLKGIRFGIDIAAVQAAIASPDTQRIAVARRLEPAPGQDAEVVEVSDDIHRSNAPRQLSNGKLDLMRFQNRFPQVQAGTCLLQKLPPRPGKPGFELSGIRIDPAVPSDLDFTPYAGPGTRIEPSSGGDYLVATRAGFLNVDPKTHQVAIEDKVISRDGVSAKTTGNLELQGDYEEFGEVQEKRVVEGNGITIHGDVYGEVVSRGGSVRLRANLVGGSAHNRHGDIQIDGVASSATVVALDGTVTLARAENCVVAGTRVEIAQAVNCEIIADELSIGEAEGCAVAARRVTIEKGAPRRGSEMLVHVLCADCARIDAEIEQVGARLAGLDASLASHRQEQAQLCSDSAVRRYLEIAGRVRSGETTLTPAQAGQFRQLGLAVAPQLTRIGELGAARKALEAQQLDAQALLARHTAQRLERLGASEVVLAALQGETSVRQLLVDPDAPALRLASAREIRQRLRASTGKLLHAAADGDFRWNAAAM